jgi:UDP-N-acetylglucosamine--N-acetylmuramyl-(pentapeptide) pyrophosphoryl-undecaprenol N-acetylglucosamine transferase
MLALADALLRRGAVRAGLRITCLGTARGMETRLVPARGYDLRLIPPVPLPRRPTLDLLRVPGRVARSVAETRALLRELSADVVVGLRRVRRAAGLPGRPPRAGAGRRARAERAARAGQPRRRAGRGPGGGHRAGHAPAPRRARRDATAHGDHRPRPRRDPARRPGRVRPRRRPPTLLVFGGSQGAASLNRAAVAAADALTAAGIQVLHARGPKNTDVTVPPRPAGSAPYVVVDYLERMDLAYAAADLALCRAGAVTVAELSAVGLPAAFVPLPIGNGEQRRNALPVCRAGVRMLVDERTCRVLDRGARHSDGPPTGHAGRYAGTPRLPAPGYPTSAWPTSWLESGR